MKSGALPRASLLGVVGPAALGALLAAPPSWHAGIPVDRNSPFSLSYGWQSPNYAQNYLAILDQPLTLHVATR